LEGLRKLYKNIYFIKEMKSDELNKDIMKLRFNGGKKKKLRATNFVYAISNIKGVRDEEN